MMKIRKYSNFFLGLPSFVWLVIFYAIPVLVIFLLAFKPVDSNGGIGAGWTLSTLRDLSNPSYPAIIWRTFWLGIVSTAICIAVAIPISYQLSRMSSRLKNLFLLLIIVPFWTNFLIRIYAWKVFLHPDGFFKKLLVLIGLIPDSTMLLYNQWAVLAVMVYTYIPFAVLPIYAASEKFDFSLLDAAKDLGASSFYAFRKIFLPGIANGVTVAIMVVLIPAFGAYLIPDLVGGPA
ncbi:MAG: ABC transporter permease, partial [Lentisphaeria bacterium]|nr:ABC transporter permease [Lentisphaeria bacterium]